MITFRKYLDLYRVGLSVLSFLFSFFSVSHAFCPCASFSSNHSSPYSEGFIESCAHVFCLRNVLYHICAIGMDT